MTTNKKENQEHPSDVFDNNFEVIYEGDLPELPNDLGNDDYKDVLSNLSELDTTSSVGIDYLEQNRTKSFVNPDTPQSRHSQSTGSPNLTHCKPFPSSSNTSSYCDCCRSSGR